MDRKAQLGSLQQIIITLVVVGIVLGVGFMVLEEFTSTMADTSGSVTNETKTLATAGVYVDYNSTTDQIFCYRSFTIAAMSNNSDGALIPSSNYTVVATTGIVTPESNSLFGDTSVNISYSYLYATEEGCGAVEDTITAIGKIPTWLSIIVILFIVGILLAIVFRVLPTEPEGGFAGIGGSVEGGAVAEI